MQKLFGLGVIVGSLESNEKDARLVLMKPEMLIGTTILPAKSVTIGGTENLTMLRNAIDAFIGEMKKQALQNANKDGKSMPRSL